MGNVAGFGSEFATFDWRRLGDAAAIDLHERPTHSPYYARNPVMNDVTERLALLNDGQRDCLRLVYAHMTSKDIARILEISPHTVDMRLRTAMKVLGVASRIEAARALVDAEGLRDGYQPLIYQSPDVAGAGDFPKLRSPASTASDEYATQHSDPRLSPDSDPPAGGPPRPAGASLSRGGDLPIAVGRQGERDLLAPLAGSLPWGARNTLAPGARLAWIAAIAIGSALGFGAILGALEALTRLL